VKRTYFVPLIFALLLAACGPAPDKTVTGVPVGVAGGSYKDIVASELEVMLRNKDFAFVNVHIPFEGNIPDTDLSIPYDQITESPYLSQLPADKEAKIVLYCRSGRMSSISAEALVGLGYRNIWNLKGGMVEWEQAGFDIEQQE
jgi:rhodanese-related sulfurtransferase